VDRAAMRSAMYGGLPFFLVPVRAGNVDRCAHVPKTLEESCRRVRKESTTREATATPMAFAELNKRASLGILDRLLHQRT
jgi:hypothetical protein